MAAVGGNWRDSNVPFGVMVPPRPPKVIEQTWRCPTCRINFGMTLTFRAHVYNRDPIVCPVRRGDARQLPAHTIRDDTGIGCCMSDDAVDIYTCDLCGAKHSTPRDDDVIYASASPCPSCGMGVLRFRREEEPPFV